MRIRELRRLYAVFGILMGLAACGIGLPVLSSLGPNGQGSDVAQMSLVEVETVLRSRLSARYRDRAPALAVRLLELSEEHRFRPSFLLGLIQIESSFRPDARSHAGAVGLMQLMPETAEYTARKWGVTEYRRAGQLTDPRMSLTLGVTYLASLRDRFEVPALYLAAYNLGPARVDALRRRSPARLKSIRWYVDRVAESQMLLLAEVRSEKIVQISP